MRFTGIAGLAILHKHLLHQSNNVRPDQTTRVPVTADQWHLRYHALHSTIERTDHDHMRAAVA